jgi:hypothetical protein
LRLAQSAQSLDSASAHFFRLMPQVGFKRRAYIGASVGTQPLEIFDGFGCQDDLEPHSGQNIAKLSGRQIGGSPPRRGELVGTVRC